MRSPNWWTTLHEPSLGPSPLTVLDLHPELAGRCAAETLIALVEGNQHSFQAPANPGSGRAAAVNPGAAAVTAAPRARRPLPLAAAPSRSESALGDQGAQNVHDDPAAQLRGHVAHVIRWCDLNEVHPAQALLSDHPD